MDSTSLHLLMVGISREVHRKAASQNMRMTLLVRRDRLRTGDDLSIYHRVLALPLDASVEEWLGQARAVQGVDPIQGVGVFPENAEAMGAEIASALGLPYHDAAVVRNTHSKSEMRRALAAAGLDDTHCLRLRNPGVEQIERFAAERGYPVIVKPLDGRASLGVSVVRDANEIPAAIEWFKQGVDAFPALRDSTEMLVEQFLEGVEWSVEAFSEDGRHRIICITRKFKDMRHFVEVGHCLPATDLAPETAESIHRAVKAMLMALGIRNGPSHTELIVTDRGPRIVETHTRLAGDCIVDLIDIVSGVDLDELWLRQVAGEKVLSRVPELRAGRHASIRYAAPMADGVLRSIEGADAVGEMEGVRKVMVLCKAGDRLESSMRASSSRIAYVIAEGESEESAVAAAVAGSRQLRCVVECGG